MRSSVLRTRGRRSRPDAWPTAIAVGDEPEQRQQREREPEHQQHEEHRAVAVDELRQEAREEDGDLRVREVAQQALAQRLAAAADGDAVAGARRGRGQVARRSIWTPIQIR